MKEIRLHGRGGQGCVLAAELLVNAFVLEGKYGNAIPFFGFERRGAPLSAFVRLSEAPIREKTQVYTPDCVIVIDPTLQNAVDIFAGLQGDGILVLNTTRPLERLDLPASVRKVALVDATRIALDIFGLPFTNTAMLGAFAAATGWVALDSLLATLTENLQDRSLEKNLEACRRGYQGARVHDLALAGS